VTHLFSFQVESLQQRTFIKFHLSLLLVLILRKLQNNNNPTLMVTISAIRVFCFLLVCSVVVANAHEQPQCSHDPAFFSGLTGHVVSASSPDYVGARLDWNTAVSLDQPCVIVFCSTSNDVVNAVSWALQKKMPIAVRSGRHSYEGYSLSPGIVIDVKALGYVQFSPGVHTAIVGAGSSLFFLYAEFLSLGYIFPGGTCPTVGVSGFTLGGGYGFFSRKWGLAVDSLVSVEMVIPSPDGSPRGVLVNASATQHADLFWAVRGGGAGNFGVVVAFEFRRLPAPTGNVTVYRIDFPTAAGALGARVMDTWQRWVGDTPRNLTGQLSVYHTSMSSTGLYLGPPTDIKALVAPLLALPDAQLSSLTEMSTMDFVLLLAGCTSLEDCVKQTFETPSPAKPEYWKAKSFYVTDPLPGAGLSVIFDRFMGPEFRNCCGNNFAGLLIDPYGGAIADVPAADTAFAHRDALYHIQLMSYWSDPADEAAAQQWSRAFDAALRPYTASGAYFGYCDSELKDWPSAYYGANYARLQKVKRAVDPAQAFQYGQSVVPSAA
jgi:FAD/FMN-containing dehydrogenase